MVGVVLRQRRRRAWPRVGRAWAAQPGPLYVVGIDAGAGVFSSVGGGHCDGSLQVIINQCVIPCTMAVSMPLRPY